MRSCTYTTTPRRTFSPSSRRACLPSTPAPAFSLPPIPPTVCSLAAVVCSGCSAVHHSSGTLASRCTAFGKIFFQARGVPAILRRSVAFFCACLIAYTPPHSHVVTRKENRLICEVIRRAYLPPYQHFTHSKKKFRFLQKNLQKNLQVSKIVTTFAHVR